MGKLNLFYLGVGLVLVGLITQNSHIKGLFFIIGMIMAIYDIIMEYIEKKYNKGT